MIIPRSVRLIKEKYDHRAGPFSHLFATYEGDEVVSLDCETTSLDVNKAEIVSIAAVKIRDNKLLNSERLDIKLKPPQSLSGDSIKIHKIRETDLADGIEADYAIDQLLEFIGNRPILGYNINYDIRILDKYIRPRHGFGLPNKAIELSRIYQSTVKKPCAEADVDLRFDTISARLDIPMIKRHTALGDALTVALMYVRLKYGERPNTH